MRAAAGLAWVWWWQVVLSRPNDCESRSRVPVFVYDSSTVIGNAWLRSLVEGLVGGRFPSSVIVDDPAMACYLLVTSGPAATGPFGDASAAHGAAPLRELPFWGACGSDHVVFMSEHPDEEVPSFDVGGASVARYALTRRSWRHGRDVQLPVYYPRGPPHKTYGGRRRTDGSLDDRLGERQLLLGFVGSIPAAGAPVSYTHLRAHET